MGKTVAVSAQNGPLMLWDLGSRQPLATLSNYGGDRPDLAFSRDGKYACLRGSDRVNSIVETIQRETSSGQQLAEHQQGHLLACHFT